MRHLITIKSSVYQLAFSPGVRTRHRQPTIEYKITTASPSSWRIFVFTQEAESVAREYKARVIDAVWVARTGAGSIHNLTLTLAYCFISSCQTKQQHVSCVLVHYEYILCRTCDTRIAVPGTRYMDKRRLQDERQRAASVSCPVL